MKKTFYPSLLALTCIATLLLAGCQKDSTTLRLYAANFGGNGKVYMVNRLPHWAEDDAVWCDDADDDNHLATVSEVSSDGTATISVLSVNDGYRLIYPYNIVTSVDGFQATLEIPSVQRYYEVDGKQVVNAPMAAFTSNGSSVHFHNLGALIAINIYNNTEYPNLIIDKVIVSSASENLPLWGTATVDDISSNAPSYHCDANSIPSGEDPYSISLVRYDEYDAPIPIYTFNRNQNDPNSAYKQVYVYVPDHGSVDNRYAITIVARSSSTVSVNDPDCSRTQTQQSPRGGNLERNKMASITYDMFEVHAPTGAIDAKFTINGNGDQVYFAAGNLQYNANDGGTWRFAPNQYDYISAGGSSSNVDYGDNTQIGESYNGWIDLFGWATSGFDNTSTGATKFHPWDFQKDNTSNYGYGPLNTSILDGNYANYDWGVYHSNVDGIDDVIQFNNDDVTGNWRTLTTSEWGYVLGYTTNTDPSDTEVRYVNNGFGQHYCWDAVKYQGGTPGILIYPDGYTGQRRPISSAPFDITDADLQAGCVFLPATGQRNIVSTTISIINRSYGFYWSSNGNSTNTAQAYSLKFNITNSGAAINGNATSTNRYLGCAVRLVSPVNNPASNN